MLITDPEQLIRLRTLLARSRAFDTDITLRALFVDPRILPWRESIVAAPAVAERVNQLIDLLLDREHRDLHQNALLLFLHVLGESLPSADKLRYEILAFAAEFTSPITAPASYTRLSSPPTASTIDREEAIALFQQILAPSSPARILRLSGTEKMGKSHLMRLYRHIAQDDYHALCALVDVRAATLNYSDILHQFSQQLGIPLPVYQSARDDLSRRLEKNAGSLTQFLNKLSSVTRDDESTRHTRHRLTAAFVQDLRALSPSLTIVLLLDSLDQAGLDIQNWIIDDLLTALCPLEHTRVVLAGRQLPPSSGAWLDLCCSHELQPVAPAHYRHYCDTIGIPLAEDQLELLHCVLDGKPGQLVDMTPKLLTLRGAQ